MGTPEESVTKLRNTSEFIETSHIKVFWVGEFKFEKMTTWTDIQKLAADFQRVQLGQVYRRLADRNCVEIVSKLIEFGMIDIIFTVDGKEYVTKKHLTTQIKNECLGNEGRVHLADLVQILNVEYQHIENRASDIVKMESNFLLCFGQLISREYVDSICAEVNDRLRDCGRISISQITKIYDLPSDMLKTELIQALFTKQIDGILDQDDSTIIYTFDYVATQKAIICGALTALTKVTAVQTLLGNLKVPKSLFFHLVDELISCGQLEGKITGGQNVERSFYVPDIYNDLMQSFLLEFFHQNGYIELATLKKLGIADHAAYLKELLAVDEWKQLVQLSTCLLSSHLWSQLASTAVSALTLYGCTDMRLHIPITISNKDDVSSACDLIIRDNPQWKVCNDTYIYTDSVISDCLKTIDPILNKKACEEAPNVTKMLKEMQISKKDEACKKRNVRKGKKTRKDDDGSDEKPFQWPFEFLSETEIVSVIKEQSETLRKMTDEVLLEIAETIRPQLNCLYKERLQSVFISSQQDVSKLQKRSHSEFQHKLADIYNNICLFDAATFSFPDGLAAELRQYLQRTLCTDAAHLALSYVSGSVASSSPMTGKMREQTIASLESLPARHSFIALFNSLATKKDNLDDFFEAFHTISGPSICALSLKQPDKKARLELLREYMDELKRQMDTCDDTARGLLLTLLLLLAKLKGIAVHASGKFVPSLIELAETCLDEQSLYLLRQARQDVVSGLREGRQQDVDTLHRLRQLLLAFNL